MNESFHFSCRPRHIIHLKPVACSRQPLKRVCFVCLCVLLQCVYLYTRVLCKLLCCHTENLVELVVLLGVCFGGSCVLLCSRRLFCYFASGRSFHSILFCSGLASCERPLVCCGVLRNYKFRSTFSTSARFKSQHH